MKMNPSKAACWAAGIEARYSRTEWAAYKGLSGTAQARCGRWEELKRWMWESIIGDCLLDAIAGGGGGCRRLAVVGVLGSPPGAGDPYMGLRHIARRTGTSTTQKYSLGKYSLQNYSSLQKNHRLPPPFPSWLENVGSTDYNFHGARARVGTPSDVS